MKLRETYRRESIASMNGWSWELRRESDDVVIRSGWCAGQKKEAEYEVNTARSDIARQLLIQGMSKQGGVQ